MVRLIHDLKTLKAQYVQTPRLPVPSPDEKGGGGTQTAT